MHRSLATASLLAAMIPHALGKPVDVLSTRSSACCSDKSFHNFAWTVQDFAYHASEVFSTPAHQNSWGYVNFNLSNPAVPDVVASCSAASDQLEDFFYGTLWYDCTFNGTISGPAPATFAFNRPTGELDVNQTWTCDDQDPEYPYVVPLLSSLLFSLGPTSLECCPANMWSKKKSRTRFTAAGKVNVTLECTETQYQNTNWTIGQIYSDTEIKCQPVTTLVAPYEVSAVA